VIGIRRGNAFGGRYDPVRWRRRGALRWDGTTFEVLEPAQPGPHILGGGGVVGGEILVVHAASLTDRRRSSGAWVLRNLGDRFRVDPR